MADPNLPQCMSTMRLHEMLLDGTLGEREQRALETDRRVSSQYRALRSCDGAFEAMVSLQRPQHHAATDGNSPEAAHDAPGAARAANKPPKVVYAEYLYCASNALCTQPLREWGMCIKAVKDGEAEISECATNKRLLERCLRGKTEHLLRSSQPQVFRPGAEA